MRRSQRTCDCGPVSVRSSPLLLLRNDHLTGAKGPKQRSLDLLLCLMTKLVVVCTVVQYNVTLKFIALFLLFVARFVFAKGFREISLCDHPVLRTWVFILDIKLHGKK